MTEKSSAERDVPADVRDSGASAGSLCSRGARRGQEAASDTGRCVQPERRGGRRAGSGRKPRRGAGRPHPKCQVGPSMKTTSAGWDADVRAEALRCRPCPDTKQEPS